MYLIQVDTLLAPITEPRVVMTSPFMGGALHGVVESLMLDHQPELAVQLGMVSQADGHAIKRYAIIAPPFDMDFSSSLLSFTPCSAVDSALLPFQFAIVVYHDDPCIAETLSTLLKQHWTTLQIGKVKDRLHRVSTRLIPLSLEPLFLKNEASPVVASSLRLKLQTPLLLPHPMERNNLTLHSDTMQPPELLNLVLSLKRRLYQLAPYKAVLLGIHQQPKQQSNAWIDAEESLRNVVNESSPLQLVRWQYGSRTKRSVVHFYGGLGELNYTGDIHPLVHQLIDWGMWLGIGQRTTLGQGTYIVR